MKALAVSKTELSISNNEHLPPFFLRLFNQRTDRMNSSTADCILLSRDLPLFGQWSHGTARTILTAPSRNNLAYLLTY